MAETFKIGDLVRLRSGSPALTIERIGKNAGGVDAAICSWFREGTRERGEFVLGTLVRDEGRRDRNPRTDVNGYPGPPPDPVWLKRSV